MSDGFLSRWSRRKRDEARRPAEAPEPPAADVAAESSEEGEGLTPEELAALPSLDTLTAATDLAPFLRAGVPRVLRNAALAARFAVLMRRKQSAVIELCEGLRAVDALAANDVEIESLAANAVIVTTYWMSYRRLAQGAAGGGSSSDAVPDMQFARGVSQVLALVVPYLVGAHRVLAQRLRERYLDNEHAG